MWSMRKVALALLIISALILSAVPSAYAGLNAEVNLDNPRVVPIWGASSVTEGASNRGWWSGYLYSSRIVLTAAHSTYIFDSDKNRQINEPPFIMVGKPNSNVKNPVGAVKVIKTLVADYKLGKTGFSINDFIVYVLEKDLVPMAPSKLLTPEIERELVAAKAELDYHGYGEYRDRCAPGQSAPCQKDWNDPNQSGSDLPRINKINLAPITDFTWMNPDIKSDLQFETFISKHKGCSGDSGGPITVMYQNELTFLGQGLLGARVYACGAGGAKSKENDEQSFGFFSPVHKHLYLIKQAEELVAQQEASERAAEKAAAELKAKQEAEAKAAAELKAKQEAEAKVAVVKAAASKKTTITCVKGKLTKKITAVNPKCPAGYKKR